MVASVVKGYSLRVGDQLLTGSGVQPWTRITAITPDFEGDPVWLDVQCEHQATATISANAKVIVLREGPVF